MLGRLHVVRTSPRLTPGAFRLAEWTLFTSLPVVAASESDQVAELRRQGVDVQLMSSGIDDVVDGLVAVADRADGSIVWLDDSRPERAESTEGLDPTVDVLVARWRERGGEVVDHGVPGEPAGSHLLDLVRVMDVLRSPGGCPWDAKQTHESLLRYLVEETYEVVDAVQGGDDKHLREELGDLLLQVVFHSRIAHERDDEAWSIDDVADGIVAKLVRRHPHVFARPDDGSAPLQADDVDLAWKALKAAEKQRSGVLDGVPMAQPSLLLAAALVSRADDGAIASVEPTDVGVDAQRWGDHLLGLAAAAAAAGVDPEAELRAAVRRAAERIDEGGAG